MAGASERIEREPDRIRVALGNNADLATVRELIAVERACCPFFELELDGPRRELTIAVGEPEHRPALDAIGSLLAAP